LARHRAARGLLVAGSVSLIAQPMLGAAVFAQPTTDALDVEHTVEARAAPTPTVVPTPEPKLVETGVASTYGEGDGFEGARTACGQVFHTMVVQIAHKTLPCGTMVRVVDTSTGNSVDAPVTDRGPYIPGRVVDLSWAAFQQLDPTGPGLLHVNIYVIDQ
jgi:rare lipoprotein A (peptidoglycan hydrolase)